MPAEDHAAARATGEKRFSELVARLGRQIAGGRRVLEEALGELVPEPGDFASLADLDDEEPATRRRANGEAPETDGNGRPDA